jgi:hypothetical protein
MAREKVTITLDRKKAEAARQLSGAASTSEAIDVALDRFIWSERLQRDIAAYRRIPPTEEEIALARLAPRQLLDDTDWEALYADDES